jgi:hypothetical protein
MSDATQTNSAFFHSAGTPPYLNGGCQCCRNQYVVSLPENADAACKVVFDMNPTHRTRLLLANLGTAPIAGNG